MTSRTSRTKPPVLNGRSTTYRLGPRRVLEAGDEAEVHFPGKRKSYLRASFRYATGDTLVFVKPTTGGLVGVTPDAVGTIHNDRKLRGGAQ